MGTHMIDRLTSTLTFRVLFFLSAVLVLPVLALGLLFTSGFLLSLAWQRETALEVLAFASLSLGGAVGTVGWILSLIASRNPERYSLTAIFVCLTIGVVTALAVTAYSIGQMLEGLRSPWDPMLMTAPFAVFGTATTIWVLDGIGRMQVLARRYWECTGHAFDAMPVVFLMVSIGLAAGGVAASVTL